MAFNPTIHRRRSIRLRHHDFSKPGLYFVTVCTSQREFLFGDMVDRSMVLNPAGEMVRSALHALPNHYQYVQLDQFVIMPNHVHVIVVLTDAFVGAGFKPAPTKRHALPEIIRAFKTFSSRRINQWREMSGVPVWQRNYYERVLRNEVELNRIREYIRNNPLNWEMDEENPGRT